MAEYQGHQGHQGHRANPEDLEPIEQLLRSALSAEAAAARPSNEGLQRIRAAIEASGPASSPARAWLRTPGAAPLGPSPSRVRRFWLPSMAAAAAIALMAVAAPQLIDVRGSAPSSVAAIGTGDSPSGTAPRAALVVEPLPVYYTRLEQGRWALVREFAPTTITDPSQRLAEALRLAVAGRAADPDYTSVWRQAHLTTDSAAGLVEAVSATARPDGIDIRLGPELVQSGEVSIAQSRLAVQQLIWTATAAAQQMVPVRITSTDGSSWLFGRVGLTTSFERTVAEGDPRAPVWVNSVVDGQGLAAGTVTISGDVAVGSEPVRWRLRRVTAGGSSPLPTAEDVGSGLAETGAGRTSTAEARPGTRPGTLSGVTDGAAPDAPSRIVWQIHPTMSEPGTYQLDVTVDGWTETKTLLVR